MDLDKGLKADALERWLEIPHDYICRSRFGSFIDYEKGLADIIKFIGDQEKKNGIVYDDVSGKDRYGRASQVEQQKQFYKCELCGGTSWKKEGAVFVCKSCGCEYSLEEMRKLQCHGEGNSKERRVIPSEQHSSKDRV